MNALDLSYEQKLESFKNISLHSIGRTLIRCVWDSGRKEGRSGKEVFQDILKKISEGKENIDPSTLEKIKSEIEIVIGVRVQVYLAQKEG